MVEDALTKIPAEVLVGLSVFVIEGCCSNAPFAPAWATPVTLSAPPEMVRFVPVISVITTSVPTFKLSVTVVVAFKEPDTRRFESIVLDPLMIMPAAVFVGVRRFVAMASNAPANPVCPFVPQ